MTHAVLLSMILLQAAASASAVPPASSPAPNPAAASTVAANTPPEDPVVCRRVPVPGSAFDRKECHTLKTWARLARSEN